MANPKPKVALGIVSYGPQSPHFYIPLADFTGKLYQDGVDYMGIHHSGVSNTDTNRNVVVKKFLEGKADWLFWIDADNPPPQRSLRRLLSHNQPAVSGLYYGGSPTERLFPVAYVKIPGGAYKNLRKVRDWEKGEVLQVDAVGMGCFLTHRSVYDKIQEDYTYVQRASGGLLAIKKGNIKSLERKGTNPYIGTVRKGIYYDPVGLANLDNPKFPFFISQYNRTEDMPFCEMVRCSHEIWLDTSIEVGHVKEKALSGEDYREGEGQIPDPAPQEVEIV
jgi:hypothetical protein